MKIEIITDIHGNYPALSAVFSDIVSRGKKILITHYHMKNGEREIIDETPSGLKLDARYEGSPYSLVCFGHHHPIHYFKTDQRVYLNPGALGCNDHAIARYAVVELQKRTVNIQLIGTTYDNKAFLESFEQLKVPDREFMIKAFHGNQLERDFKDGSNIS